MLPAPASEPMVSLPPFKVRVAPLLTVTALLSPMLLPPSTRNSPVDTVTAPLWVLVPLRVSVPAPDLVKSPGPDSTPDRATALALLMVAAAFRAMALLMVVVVPLVIVRSASRVKVPDPILLPLVIDRPPPRTVVPPE